MTDKEKIRNIIELFIAWNGETEAIDTANIDSAVEFIGSSLQPVSEDLENAALEYATHYDKNWSEVKYGYIAENEAEAFKAGAKWQKEQIMKETIDATLLNRNLIKQKHTTHPLYVGDKVKIIIIKED